jgi:hypothetical protein
VGAGPGLGSGRPNARCSTRRGRSCGRRRTPSNDAWLRATLVGLEVGKFPLKITGARRIDPPIHHRQNPTNIADRPLECHGRGERQLGPVSIPDANEWQSVPAWSKRSPNQEPGFGFWRCGACRVRRPPPAPASCCGSWVIVTRSTLSSELIDTNQKLSGHPATPPTFETSVDDL